MFMNLDQNKFPHEDNKDVELKNEKKELKKELALAVKALNAQRAKVQSLFNIVKGTPGQWVDENLGKLIKNMNLLKELKFRIELPHQEEGIKQTLENIRQDLPKLADLDDILQNIADLNIQIEVRERLKEMVNLYGDVLTMYTQHGALPGDLNDVKVDVMVIEKEILDLKKARKSNLKDFKNPISQKIKQIKEQIKKDDTLNTYMTIVKNFKDEKKILEKKSSMSKR